MVRHVKVERGSTTRVSVLPSIPVTVTGGGKLTFHWPAGSGAYATAAQTGTRFDLFDDGERIAWASGLFATNTTVHSTDNSLSGETTENVLPSELPFETATAMLRRAEGAVVPESTWGSAPEWIELRHENRVFGRLHKRSEPYAHYELTIDGGAVVGDLIEVALLVDTVRIEVVSDGAAAPRPRWRW